jgi:photosystem II stability/assembly factor-like uncharacterized protein
MKLLLYVAILFQGLETFAQTEPTVLVQHHDVPSSFRGIDVSPNGTVWVSGSHGTIGWSHDQAQSWKFLQVPGFEKAEFRDIELLTDSTIILMSSVNPAALLRSTDGGKHFTASFYSEDSSIFLDGMDFYDEKQGICYGDPVSGNMLVLQSEDGGVSWKQTEHGPKVETGTAAFAASGSGIWYLNAHHILLLTGGFSSDVYQSYDGGNTWQQLAHLSFESGQTSGAYSMWFTDSLNGYVVGGDYTRSHERSNNCFFTRDGGKSWLPAAQMPAGYKSVIVANQTYVMVAGTAGVDMASTENMLFQTISSADFNTAMIHHNMLYLAGSKGCTGSMQLR